MKIFQEISSFPETQNQGFYQQRHQRDNDKNPPYHGILDNNLHHVVRTQVFIIDSRQKIQFLILESL